ncbi:terminase large subunit domain-containing protein [Consotaella salsifontis]|uniref:Phage terminase-like protein, large subunit, contains N-terminal HTH domain n=1 Tax=Consotaella salsifontis TaxID=1365950 RepID=A0A1T4SJT9_9HYPH|nr:terminase large subunit [Consotaella salsifontis]SKA28435.1 Phage terminase-like protein, large subunit, contains N-terminal HTH domain [Consotaella salsifontis]
MTPATRAIRFIEGLEVPTGALSGKPLKLAPYQKQFLRGALAKGISIGVLSVARGGGKSALTAGVALGHLLGEIDPQPRRECLVAARTRDQGRIVWDYVTGLARTLPEDVQKRLTFRRAPRLEIEYESDDGPHLIRVLAADGKNALGTSPSLVICDERGNWDRDKGDALEHALSSGCGKRGGRMLLISTSAPDDSHPFSRWLDDDQPGVYRQEHKADDGCAPDDVEQIRKANPGAAYGVGASIEWLTAQARRAVDRGGSALTSWRLYNLNQRVAGEDRDVVLTTDQWLACEASELPPRAGPVVVGIDLGGSASMTAASYYWFESGRLEAIGWFPSHPSLLNRGQVDGVKDRYVQMRGRGELFTLGAQTVPVAEWLVEAMRHVEGEQIAALVMDRYKQAELGEAIDKAGIRAPIVWRGMGWKDGSEDIERFRRACFDRLVKTTPSLLLRSAFSEAVVLIDPASNAKLAKGRSLGRIDAAASTILAVAEGARRTARPVRTKRAPVWA